MRLLFLLAVFVLSACGHTPAPVSLYGATSGVGSSGVHTVSRGDTLSSISKRYKVDMPEIVMANSLSSPYRLQVGQRLRLPPPEEYEVRPGDSLSEVARLFNVSSGRLAELNHLNSPYKIYAGEILNIPGVRGLEGEILSASFTAGAVQVGSVTRSVLPPQAVKNTHKSNLKAPVSSSQIKKKIFSKPQKFIRPVSGKVISGFGPKKNGLHNDGWNIKAARGTPVKSAAEGQVVYAGNELKGYGNLVLIKHGGRYLTAYAHLGEILVKKGDVLRQGQTLGTVGSSGQVGTPQLHFEIRQGTKAIAPDKYI